ncbi:MAG: AAA family ATPase [Candidatus Altiarchaeales archaeon]|nr:AAA family ATPase [Candidatus Altiarchaeales archaeon]MBD3416771.1 AAA family ATPase [Candidatus Altiarchaeales archaeon]
MEREEYYKKFGWRKSPFIKSTSLDIPIIERIEEYEEVCECIGGWDRIMVVTAPIGYGKTTFMNQLSIKKPRGVKYVVPFNAYEPVEEVMEKVRAELPFVKRIFSKTDRTGFGEMLQSKLGDDKMLLVFDEAQDYENDLFKWLRILNDRTDNIFMIFLGLRGLEDRITAETSFRDRKSKSIGLRAFETEDLVEMIRQRIAWAGGKTIKPFTELGLVRLCESCKHVPRQLLENGQRLIEESAREDVEEIDEEFVESTLGRIKPETVEKMEAEEDRVVEAPVERGGFMQDLSPTQQEIVQMLLDHESLSIAEISEQLNKDIRSVGSLIRKLRGLNKKEVERKPNIPYPVVVRKGKEVRLGRLQYVFSLSDNSRRLLGSR